MVRECMGDLVGEHDREPVLVLGDGEDPAVDGDLATGHAPGIDRLGVVDDRRLPLIAGMELRLGGVRQSLAHSLNQVDVLGIGVGLRLGELLLVRLHPKLVDRRIADQIELLAPGDWRRRASREHRRHDEECFHTRNLDTAAPVCSPCRDLQVPRLVPARDFDDVRGEKSHARVRLVDQHLHLVLPTPARDVEDGQPGVTPVVTLLDEHFLRLIEPQTPRFVSAPKR